MSDPSFRYNINNSKCRYCVHRVTRVIMPQDPAEYGIDVESEEFAAGSGNIIIEHHICVDLDIDLDHDVLECSRFESEEEPEKESNLIKGDLPLQS